VTGHADLTIAGLACSAAPFAGAPGACSSMMLRPVPTAQPAYTPAVVASERIQKRFSMAGANDKVWPLGPQDWSSA
jgi:hypothetical protein